MKNCSDPTHALNTSLDRCLEALETGGPLEARWCEVFQALDQARSELSTEHWCEVARSVREHALFKHAQEEPVTHRAFSKPRGYAGDAVTMDLLYRSAPEATEIGAAPPERLGRLLLDQAPAIGVRERRSSMARTLERLGRRNVGSEVLSVACGHMREAGKTPPSGAGIARLVGLDQDGRSLSEVRRSLRGRPVETVERSVRTLLRGEAGLGRFDLIYSMGLYDYLEERTAQRLTRVLFDQLRPGGRLMIANFLPIPMRGYMEAFMDWWLVYRTPTDLARLTMDLEDREVGASAVMTDSTDAIAWLDVRRAA
jgi:extracellular factor (EF) 3-hydroxypalmitic acid methyl ester biosynthesis protein